jgi:hypothetical protein
VDGGFTLILEIRNMESLDLVLHSDSSPCECLAKLAEQMDLDRLTLFSFSGYRGKKPMLGRIAGNEFRLHKRRYWHNSFGPVLYGRVTGADLVQIANAASWRQDSWVRESLDWAGRATGDDSVWPVSAPPWGAT